MSHAALAKSPAAAIATTTATANWVNGKWAYISYLNEAKQTEFGAGEMVLACADGDSGLSVTGTLAMPNDPNPMLYMDLKGGAIDATKSIHVKGYGRANTPTAGWRYDYQASLAYQWPSGIAQVPAFVGNVIRVVDHGTSKAGVVASYIAVYTGPAPAKH